jgi:hypothetical protein
MHHTICVCDGQRRGNFEGESYHFCFRKPGQYFEATRERKRQQIHCDEDSAFAFTHIANENDVGVPESRGGGGLAAKAGLGGWLARVFGAKHLERDRNLEIEVDRFVYPRKCAGSEESCYSIFAENSA